MKVVTAEQMRSLEQRAENAGISVDILMENAGLRVAERTREQFGEVRGLATLVLVGPGNNGGDGLVAARHLARWGARVALYLCASRPEPDPKLDLVDQLGVPMTLSRDDEGLNILDRLLDSSKLVIDAVLGTGRARPLEGTIQAVFHKLKTARERRKDLFLLALDLPTGLNCDTGDLDAAAVAADLTVTLGYPKLGLFQFPGAAAVGRLQVADIGIPPALSEDIPLELLTPEWVASTLPRRPLDAHKGTFGRLLVVAGSISYIGAAYLACTAATRVGTGLVALATGRSIQSSLAAKLTEVVYLPLPEIEPGIIGAEAAPGLRRRLVDHSAVLIGCGLGQHPGTAAFLRSLLFHNPGPELRLILDADALNIVSAVPRWWEKLPPSTVLTPHPGEMGRLAGMPSADIQQQRLKVAQETSTQWKKQVVLKGAFTVIASPEGKLMLSPFANPGLASAGTGDVLAGVIGGLLAQGMSPLEAAACGVYLHGVAGEMAREEVGETGMVASDLLPLLPKVITRLKAHPSTPGTILV